MSRVNMYEATRVSFAAFDDGGEVEGDLTCGSADEVNRAGRHLLWQSALGSLQLGLSR